MYTSSCIFQDMYLIWASFGRKNSNVLFSRMTSALNKMGEKNWLPMVACPNLIHIIIYNTMRNKHKTVFQIMLDKISHLLKKYVFLPFCNTSPMLHTSPQIVFRIEESRYM